MFDWLKKKTKVAAAPAPAPAWGDETPVPKVKATKTKEPDKTAKQLATEKGEPYIAVLGMDVDLNNLHQGAFELDWNEIFVSRLVKAGYMIKKEDSDSEIVDRWFQNVCRHVVMETWEQEQAIKNSGIYVNTRDIGGGRSEVS
jgi:hypothetical protein